MAHNILVIGAVRSTAEVIKGLVRNNLKPVGILGYQPDDLENISGWYDLEKLAAKLDIAFQGFENINDSKHLEWALKFKPDIIFAVGFSQLLKKKWLDLPKKGCVGFHPTNLPKGRGRAPMAWIILREREGAATFFLMGEGADDGPIFIQKHFDVAKHDDAKSIEGKIMSKISEALDEWLPKLKKGEWSPQPQNDTRASWYGKRKPEDGIINWKNRAEDIDLLVKATTKPHPGAYTFLNGKKVIIWTSKVDKKTNIEGVTGCILCKDDQKVLVQCGKDKLWIKETNIDVSNLKVGMKFGYEPQNEIAKIWKELEKFKHG